FCCIIYLILRSKMVKRRKMCFCRKV
uniref:Uncharacterized protein n=1 Tax=Ciona intestinalis TaxID=7719 RepID=H2XPH5_CIOIN